MTDPAILQEVAEIAAKVRELEESVPCRVESAPNEGGKVSPDVHRGTPECEDVPQASERLVAKLHNASGDGDGGSGAVVVMGDSMKSGVVVGGSATPTASGSEDNKQCAAMSDEDIKALMKELKRKIEYTERMNWLCKYDHQGQRRLLLLW